MPRYEVKITRLMAVQEYAYVEVDAPDPVSAEQQALDNACAEDLEWSESGNLCEQHGDFAVEEVINRDW